MDDLSESGCGCGCMSLCELIGRGKEVTLANMVLVSPDKLISYTVMFIVMSLEKIAGYKLLLMLFSLLVIEMIKKKMF